MNLKNDNFNIRIYSSKTDYTNNSIETNSWLAKITITSANIGTSIPAIIELIETGYYIPTVDLISIYVSIIIYWDKIESLESKKTFRDKINQLIQERG